MTNFSFATTPLMSKTYYKDKLKEFKKHKTVCETECGCCDAASARVVQELNELMKKAKE